MGTLINLSFLLEPPVPYTKHSCGTFPYNVKIVLKTADIY